MGANDDAVGMEEGFGPIPLEVLQDGVTEYLMVRHASGEARERIEQTLRSAAPDLFQSGLPFEKVFLMGWLVHKRGVAPSQAARYVNRIMAAVAFTVKHARDLVEDGLATADPDDVTIEPAVYQVLNWMYKEPGPKTTKVPVPPYEKVVRLARKAQELSDLKEVREIAAASADDILATDVGRNDPCPCGSGKKFKWCHGSVSH